MRTLVLGVGNPTRRDDGAGRAVAGAIEARGLDQVEVRSLPQLQVEVADELAPYDRVVVVDACLAGAGVDLRPVSPAATGTASHHLSPSVLLSLTRALCGRAPEMAVCTIRGEDFGFGDTLSPAVVGRVHEAVERIVDWISTR